MQIRLLDDNLINKIAAGEVIERPVSVVKELVENAIDAGSTSIAVAIQRGGHDWIEVSDNGQGIPADQIELAFTRHATSKLDRESDLFAINTMGFRGEALPSIASVSRVNLITACRDGEGHAISMAGGRFEKSVAAAFPQGSKIRISDLFYNTPARKKFMKSSSSEAGRINAMLMNMALARPDIIFEYHNEKKLLFKTPGDGRLYNTMLSLYGSDYCRHFIEIAYQSESVSLEGYVSKVDFKRLNRRSQSFFVNRRVIESPMLSRALDEGYKGLLISREYPAAIIKINVPPEEVDVNIHPQKKEVKFQDEGLIFRTVQGTVKAALRSDSERIRENAYGFTRPDAWQKGYQIRETSNLESSYPANGQSRLLLQKPISHDVPGEKQGLQGYNQNTALNERRDAVQDMEAATGLPVSEKDFGGDRTVYRILAQLHRKYILIEVMDGLLLVDQHAAHERILFEKFKADQAEGPLTSQDLLIPLRYDLNPTRYEFVMNRLERFRELGFEIESFGETSIVIRGLPHHASSLDLNSMDEIIEIIETSTESDYHNKIMALMACRNAIKTGDRLNEAEMEALVAELLGLDRAFNCPHGRPTMVKISINDLDRRLKRLT